MRPELIAAAVGWRYAFSRRSALSLIGNIAICGLALSIAVLVVVVSVINGFERALEQRVFGVLPHLGLHGRGPFVPSAAEIDLLESLASVRAAVPFVQAVGLAAGTARVRGMLLTGIEPDNYGRVSDLGRYVDAGKSNPAAGDARVPAALDSGSADIVRAPVVLDSGSAGGVLAPAALDSGPADVVRVPAAAHSGPAGTARPMGLDRLRLQAYRVILGARLAAQLGVGVGDRITLVLPAATITPAGAFPRQKRFTVAGLLRSQSELDTRAAFVHLEDAQRLLRLGDRVGGYQLKLEDFFAAGRVAREALALLGHDRFFARSWMGTHGNLHYAIGMQKTTMFVLLAFLVAVAAFNLVSTLVMAVEQRGTDIAILKTMGAGTGSVMASFIVFGALIGGLGTAAGIALGAAGALALPEIFAWLSDTLALDLMNQYFIHYLPVELRLADLAGIAGTAFGLCLISTIHPARRAAGLLPSRVLAHE